VAAHSSSTVQLRWIRHYNV